MKRVEFEDLHDNDLFWMGQTEDPQKPQDFLGPYRKKVYREMRPEVPQSVYIKVRPREWKRSG